MVNFEVLAESRMNTTSSESLVRDAQSSVFAGERVAFTGTLASMTHQQAAELVVQQGGQAMGHVSQQTTLLVVGEEGWPLEPDGRPSVKLLQTQQLIERGQAIKILSEAEWLAALGKEVPAGPQHYFTPAAISQRLNVSVHRLRQWQRMGLLRPVKQVFRLPYFDLREVESARRLAELVAAGARPEAVAAQLQQLRRLMPGLERPLEQLELLARSGRVAYRDRRGWIEPATGQRLLDFEEFQPAAAVTGDDDPAIGLHLASMEDSSRAVGDPRAEILPFAREQASWSAADWYQEALHLLAQNELTAAVDALRLSLIGEPTSSATHFALADALYRQGNLRGAIERYSVAVELDHDFIEAWTQLGCVLQEVQETNGAIQAFRVALDRHPDYAEAHFHLANVLDQAGRAADARPHWEAYLRLDAYGPWAETAMRALGLSVATGEPNA